MVCFYFLIGDYFDNYEFLLILNKNVWSKVKSYFELWRFVMVIIEANTIFVYDYL